jgi:undecaprenyl-diphosphatase
MFDSLVQLDTRWFLFLNGLHNPFFDTVMHTLSAVAVWIPFYMILVFFIFRKLKTKGFITLFFLILLVVCTDQGSSHIKNTVKRPRPSHNPEIAQLVHIVNNERGGNFGFFSSHAANTFGLALFLSLFFKSRKFSIFIFSWAAVVSYSRIYLGVHYVFDVLVGAVFGLFVSFLIYKLYLYTFLKFESKKKPVKTGLN